jgi:hypothetical protein
VRGLAPFCFGAGGPAGLGGERRWKTGDAPFSLGALSLPVPMRRAAVGARTHEPHARGSGRPARTPGIADGSAVRLDSARLAYSAAAVSSATCV